jgi:hypothetical protein
MLNQPTADSWGPQGLPLLAAAELQDHLMTATNDLDRLQHLLAEACDTLLQSFHGASERMQTLSDAPAVAAAADTVAQVQARLGQAVMALQFQDMASQLIHHTSRRLRNCADRIAQEAMGDDEDGPALVEDAPLRPNPVVQEDMSAGSIDLF